jgi:integrase
MYKKISQGTISKRKDGKFIGQCIVTFEDNIKKRLCVSADDYYTCSQKLEDKKSIYKNPNENTSKETSIKSSKRILYVEYLLTSWVEEKQAEGLNEKSIENYISMINKNFVFFKNTYADEITSESIISFQNYLTNVMHLSNSSANKNYNIINNSFSKLVRDEYVEKNPCQYVKRKYEEEKEKEIFTKEEIKILLDEAYLYDSSHRHKNKLMFPFILFALYTGCRRSEICAIKWEDINTEKMTCSINKSVTVVVGREYLSPTKNKQVRTVPINERLLNELFKLREKIYKRCGKYSEFVFPDYRNINYYVSPRQIANSYLLLQNKTGIKKGLHAFRHTFITTALEKGISLKAVQKVVGHATLAITSRYWHPESDKFDAVRNLYIES